MSIKKFASQTAWYGLSTIVGRFLNYLLTPILTSLGTEHFGDYTTVYANIVFFNILFTYGMETAYFRFSRDVNESDVFNTSSTSLLLTTIPLMLIMLALQTPLANLWTVPDHKEYVIYFTMIVGFDTLSAIPFAKLRHEGKPGKFVLVKMVNIILNIGLVVFFFYGIPWMLKHNIGNSIFSWYNKDYGIGYAFISNMIASIVTLLLLYKEFTSFSFKIDKKLWKQMLVYALPMLIVGLGGMVNETIDRTMIPKLVEGSLEFKKSQNGIYGANYKLAILMMLFIQTFRMGAEPFLIKQSKEADAPKMYSRIMNLFVIACCFCFLGVVLYLDIWKYFMRVDIQPDFAQGLIVVPILILAKMFLGIYYNLSIWYKVTNKTMIGAYITIAGAVITVLVNVWGIPRYGYVACAWASLACYSFMMVASYILGQKHYPIPYKVGKIFTHIGFALVIYFLSVFLKNYIPDVSYRLLINTSLLIIFTITIFILEKQEFKKLPVVGKYL